MQVNVDLQHRVQHRLVIARDVLVDGGLRTLPEVFDAGLLIKSGEQRREAFERNDVRRNLDFLLVDGELGRPVAGDGERDVGVNLRVLGEECLEGDERRNTFLGELIAYGFAQRMIVGGIDLGIVACGVDGRHDGEKRGAGVKLAQLRPLGESGGGER